MNRKKSKFMIFLSYLVLVTIAVIALFPLLFAIVSSLRPNDEIYEFAMPFQLHTLIPVKWTLDSYVEIFKEYNFGRPVINTLVVSVITVVTSCLINSVAAFGFSTFEFRFKKILYGFVFVSFLMPFESIAIPLYKVVSTLGWVETYQGLIAPTVTDGLVLFLFVQFFSNIPRSLYESARLDGASWKQIFISILVPLSKPVFVTAALMVFVNQWNSFLWPLLVAHGKNMRLIQVALSDFSSQHQTLWSNLYAASVISALIPLGLFLPFQKYYVQGVVSSGVKG